MAQEGVGTTAEREGEATGVEGRTEEATTQATSPALPEGTSLENVARAETHDTNQGGATAAGRRAGGALTTTWTATAAFSSVAADGGTQVDTRVWMQPSRSSP